MRQEYSRLGFVGDIPEPKDWERHPINAKILAYAGKPPIPGKLWSWWDMLEVCAGSFVEKLQKLLRMSITAGQVGASKSRCESYNFTLQDDADALDAYIRSLTDVSEAAESLKLDCAQNRIQAILDDLNGVGLTAKELSFQMQCAIQDFFLQANGRKFLYLEDYAKMYCPADLSDFYGSHVCRRFPGYTYDLEEALNCFALCRTTAVVFHLMRVLEVAAKAVCISLGAYQPAFRGWGDYKKATEDYLNNKQNQSRPGDWSQKEPYYRDVNAQMLAVYRAWRNPTMHIEQVYTEEHAKRILDASIGLLQAVAERIDENGVYYTP